MKLTNLPAMPSCRAGYIFTLADEVDNVRNGVPPSQAKNGLISQEASPYSAGHKNRCRQLSCVFDLVLGPVDAGVGRNCRDNPLAL